MGMALDEPVAEDIVVIINEIRVAIDPQLKDDVKNLVIEYDPGRNAIVLSGNESECGN
ncbi:hypothetical protein [Cytobacillus massiliigabonensis]|uniref:hypothetical protein n=1 Tax=Cytobacillus massiliigabonensis TaxID=1871011 RepID=UPI0015E0B669|nr:hypothetical protein [Cytobacillus massiliigabonensis]